MVMAGDPSPALSNPTGLLPQFRGTPVVVSEIGFTPGRKATTAPCTTLPVAGLVLTARARPTTSSATFPSRAFRPSRYWAPACSSFCNGEKRSSPDDRRHGIEDEKPSANRLWRAGSLSYLKNNRGSHARAELKRWSAEFIPLHRAEARHWHREERLGRHSGGSGMNSALHPGPTGYSPKRF